MMERPSTRETCSVRRRFQRWLLVACGVSLVGIGGVGVFLPGLPTTVFLIGASWCFTRSCPWLEERLIRIPLFRPFLVYLDHGARMPRKTVVWTLVVMWLAIAVSATVVMLGPEPQPVFAATIVAAGIIGSWFVIRLGHGRVGVQEEPGGGSPKVLARETGGEFHRAG